ncbi:hypothetical protein QR98_0073970 [Sarcoptes scabiei]|uniref:Uncharacterized protein n=1 Tax=Sarcoptes scabiei TaxID=52283 RepID=A0A132AD28_SARSC|nr:hypothetical protein QR98_0073970 [Sarcoptes scabiei]
MHQIIQGTTWPFNESQNSNSEQRRDSVTSTIRQAYSQGSATHHQYKTFSTKKSESSSKSSTTTSSAKSIIGKQFHQLCFAIQKP